MNKDKNKPPDNGQDKYASLLDDDKIISLIDSAKNVVLKNLLKKIKDAEPLAAHEVKLLKEFEAELKARQSGTGRRLLSTQKQLAEYLGKATRTVSYYKSKNMPVNPDGTYDLDAIDAWIEARTKKGIGQPHGERPDSGDKSGWEAVYKEMKARLAELELQKYKGEVISLDEVRRQWVNRIIEVKTALLSLPRKLPPLLEGKEKRDMEAIIEDEVRFILERFSRPGGKLKKEVYHDK